MSRDLHSGSCLCGAVRFTVVRAHLDELVGCHCEQCRRTSGNHVLATRIERKHLKMERDESLRWYRSSESAQRGFCTTCGSNLFWQGDGKRNISIFAGCLDQPLNLPCRAHIYTQTCADYTSLDETTPCYPLAD